MSYVRHLHFTSALSDRLLHTLFMGVTFRATLKSMGNQLVKLRYFLILPRYKT